MLTNLALLSFSPTLQGTQDWYSLELFQLQGTKSLRPNHVTCVYSYKISRCLCCHCAGIYVRIGMLPHATFMLQLTSPVQWESTVNTLLGKGLERSYEIGPNKVIAGIMKRIDRKHSITNVSV